MNSSQPPKALPLGRVEGYFLSSLNYRIDPQWNGDPGNPITVDLGVRVDKGARPDVRQVTLRVSVKPQLKDKPIPYDVEVEAVVLLGGMPEDEDEATLVKHVALVAGPLAYGTVREELLNLSARGPFPRLLLPLVPARVLMDGAVAQSLGKGS